jgi:hypothetical protein
MPLDLSTSLHAEFSKRLLASIIAAGLVPSATELRREFNLRASSSPVTYHTVRNWLNGRTIPTQNRLVVLSRLVGVPPGWLQYGAPHHKLRAADPVKGAARHDIDIMMADVRKLDAHSRKLLSALVVALLANQLK